MSSRPDASGTRADAVRNRARLIGIAREQVLAGNTELRMHDIARAAGVGVGTVYRHFPDRRDLLEALSADGLRRLADQVRDAAADDPATGVHRLLAGALEATGDPTLAAVLAGSEEAHPGTAAVLAELRDASETVLRRAREAGAIRSDVDADDVRRLVCGIRHAARSGAAEPEAGARYLDVVLLGLRPRAGGPTADS